MNREDADKLIESGTASDFKKLLGEGQLEDIQDVIMRLRDSDYDAPGLMAGWRRMSDPESDLIRKKWGELQERVAFVGGSLTAPIVTWPEEISAYDGLSFQLQQVSDIYYWGRLFEKKEKPSQVKRRIESVFAKLRDPTIAALIGVSWEGWSLMDQLQQALGYDLVTQSVDYKSPHPTSMDLAFQVWLLFLQHDIRPSANRQGLFVATLEAINLATGMPVNAQENARELVAGRYPKSELR